MSNVTRERGIGIVEVLVVMSIALTAFMTIFQLFQLQIRAERLRREEIRAYALLSESLEAVRSVRDADWTNLSSLSIGTNYYPEILVNSWSLSVVNPGAIDGFTRWIVLDEVRRDASDNIVSSGWPVDSDTLEVIATVAWQSSGATKTKTLTVYLTNWQGKM